MVIISVSISNVCLPQPLQTWTYANQWNSKMLRFYRIQIYNSCGQHFSVKLWNTFSDILFVIWYAMVLSYTIRNWVVNLHKIHVSTKSIRFPLNAKALPKRKKTKSVTNEYGNMVFGRRFGQVFIHWILLSSFCQQRSMDNLCIFFGLIYLYPCENHLTMWLQFSHSITVFSNKLWPTRDWMQC